MNFQGTNCSWAVCGRIFLVVFQLSIFLAQATASSSPACELIVTGEEVRLRLLTSDPALRYWRIDSSEDLVTWSRAAGAGVLAGRGEAVLHTGTAGRPDRMFFRMNLDESVTNVLNLSPQLFNYAAIILPPHLRGPNVVGTDNTPADNVVTDAGATLGRVLFYDRIMSRNYSVACASCHRQENGFSDPGQFSTGFEGGLTGRNSMGLSNAKFYDSGHFFWDERAATLEVQTLQPIQNEVEMGMDLTNLVSRVQSYAYYEELFAQAFGDSTVTSDRISRALSQFVRSMLSFRSKWDAGVPVGFANFTAAEELGRQIFTGNRGNCGACHGGPNFVGNRLENNGLEFPYVDRGAGAVTGRPQDDGKFKMSSLRNVERTAPYMHDGRFATLEQVIDHYSTGVVANPNLGGPLLQPGRPGQPPQVRRPNFTPAEKAALVAFLRTLTDEEFLRDPKYATPFQVP